MCHVVGKASPLGHRICSGKSSKSVGCSRNMDSLSKVLILLFMKKQQQTRPFRFFQRVAEAFVPELTKATSGCVVHARKIEICWFALRSALCMHERHKAKKKVSWREHRIGEAASQIDLWNQRAICKYVSHEGKAWASLFIAHLQNNLLRKGDVSKHLKKHTMRSVLSPPLMRKIFFWREV